MKAESYSTYSPMWPFVGNIVQKHESIAIQNNIILLRLIRDYNMFFLLSAFAHVPSEATPFY